MHRTQAAIAELRSEQRRINMLLLERDGPGARPQRRCALNREIEDARERLGALLGSSPVKPGDLRTS